ncbi:MAG: Mrp/NBP35 family ATP-binding protein [Rickettsiaceae bacterium]|nr:Mrp/NBP35 family ATP-binding protein [Rickettsiaceae bacterium]
MHNIEMKLVQDKLTVILELAKDVFLENGINLEAKIEELIKDNSNVQKVLVIITKNSESSKTKSKIKIKNIDKIILISSGKGGVGKSTIAAAITQQLNDEGRVVGILDADIYGPSIPTIFGLEDAKIEILDQQFVPILKDNVSIMSFGFLGKEIDKSLSCRGPMATKILYQLLSLTKWPALDFLIVDMPPGTGDIHLSILENYLVDGVVIVSTPQKLSMHDTNKTIDLYKKFATKIFGVIENMSGLPGNAGENISKHYSLPLIAKVEFQSNIIKACDSAEKLSNILPRIIDKLI